MIKYLITTCFLLFIPPIFASDNCYPQTDKYYEKNIIGKRKESMEVKLLGRSYVDILIFNKDHTLIGKIADKTDIKNAAKALVGKWKIKNSKLYITVKKSSVLIPIPNSVEKIVCMNKKMYKAIHSDKTTYTSIRI
ncbi:MULTISPECIES: hypothetical protein [unclassified Legionella]|uniref:hypothetical protein n=1 Tax=unclassified Legionella TaxID=2622702 RepID=UPI001E45310C|nr:hypothetical protein [Legionella sp. 31fI33]MCC5015208.1 hypothetical protein [Legionella sp. 31fI33]